MTARNLHTALYALLAGIALCGLLYVTLLLTFAVGG